MDEKLKPCPFCGGTSISILCFFGKYGWFSYAHCDRCGAEGKKVYVGTDEDLFDKNNKLVNKQLALVKRKQAVEKWNIRYNEDN